MQNISAYYSTIVINHYLQHKPQPRNQSAINLSKHSGKQSSLKVFGQNQFILINCNDREVLDNFTVLVVNLNPSQ